MKKPSARCECGERAGRPSEAIEVGGRTYPCPICVTLDLVGGKCKVAIL